MSGRVKRETMEKFTIKPLEWAIVNPTLIEAPYNAFFYASIWEQSDLYWRGRYRVGQDAPVYIGACDSLEKANGIIERRYENFVKEAFLNPA